MAGAGLMALSLWLFRRRLHPRVFRTGLLMMAAGITVLSAPSVSQLKSPKRYEGRMWTEDGSTAVDSIGKTWRLTPKQAPMRMIQGVFRCEPWTKPLFEGGFDPQEVWRPKGFSGQARCILKVDERSIAPSSIMRLRMNWRQCIAQLKWSERSQSLVHALFLGEGKGLDKDLKRGFQALGLAHVLAVSGFHLGMLWFLGQRFSTYVPNGFKKLWDLSLILGLWLFVAFIGWPTSAIRAACMLSLMSFLRWRPGQPHRFSALAWTVWLMLMYRPEWWMDMGFQLSVLAVFGILWARLPHPALPKYLQALPVSIVAQWAVLPFCLNYFHQFPWFFLPANLLCVPVLLALYPYTMLAIALSYTGVSIPFPEGALDGLASIPSSWQWGQRYPGIWGMIALILASLMGIAAWRQRHWFGVVAAAAVTLVFMAESGPIRGQGGILLTQNRGIAVLQWHGDSARVLATKGLAKSDYIWKFSANNLLQQRGVKFLKIKELKYKSFPQYVRIWADSSTTHWPAPRSILLKSE